jgi:hypothetical protein
MTESNYNLFVTLVKVTLFVIVFTYLISRIKNNVSDTELKDLIQQAINKARANEKQFTEQHTTNTVTKPPSKTFIFSQSETVLSPENLKQTEVTVVSTYIELDRSKHSVEKYDNWIKNFAVSVRSPLAIVVNQRAYAKLKPLRENLTTIFYLVDDIWTVMKQNEIERNRSYVTNYLEKQHPMDPERGGHNPNLYGLWNLKSYIVHKVAESNPFGSSFFIYSDAGAWRHDKFPSDWPDTGFITNSLMKALNDRVLLGQVGRTGAPDVIEGTFFAGSSKAVGDFYANFWRMHDKRYEAGMFVGKDQTIMNVVAFESAVDRCVRLQTFDIGCSFGYDVWFYYQKYFSKDKNQHCAEDRLKHLRYPGDKL